MATLANIDAPVFSEPKKVETSGQLYQYLYTLCSTSSKSPTKSLFNSDETCTTKSQIGSIFSNDYKLMKYDLQQWLYEQCQTVLGAYENEVEQRKSFFTAQRAKESADNYRQLYAGISNTSSKVLHNKMKEFQAKTFDELDTAIRYAPFSERNFLFDCFAQRSNLHYTMNAFEEALADLEHALHLRPHSITCIERKISVLRKLNRISEAIQFTEQVLQAKDTIHRKWDEVSCAECNQRIRRLHATLHELQVENDKNKVTPNSLEVEDCRYNVDRLYLQLDSRVCIDEKLGLQAEADIASGCTVLREEPSVFILKQTSMNSYCATCRKSCAYCFFPCAQCTEVVYCSVECSKRDCEHNSHQLECGLVSLIQRELGTQAYQAYRLLILIGADELIHLEPEENFCLNDAKTLKNRQEALMMFAKAQYNLRTRIEQHRPERSANELASALFLASVYAYKQPKGSQMSSAKFQQLCAVLAVEIAKVQQYEYGWHKTSNTGEGKISIAGFQCLFGSRVGHGCVENAEWYFDGNHFSLKTNKPIKAGDNICINYGIKAEHTFISRQKYLSSFLTVCACARCRDEVSKNFAFRCETCSGPVPYDASMHYYNDRCMLCGDRYAYATKARTIQREYYAMHNIITLLPVIQNEEHWRSIECNMSTLACYVYPDYEQFLQLINELCRAYIGDERYHLAVEWYQWLVNAFNIHLSSLTSFNIMPRLIRSPSSLLSTTSNSIPIKSTTLTDQLVHYERLQLWTYAHVKFLEKIANQKKTKQPSPTNVLTSYIEITGELIKQFHSIWESIQANSYHAMLDKALGDNRIHQPSSSVLAAPIMEPFELKIKEFCAQLVDELRHRVTKILKRFENVCVVLEQKLESENGNVNQMLANNDDDVVVVGDQITDSVDTNNDEEDSQQNVESNVKPQVRMVQFPLESNIVPQSDK